MSGASAAVVAAPPPPQKLDELMMAMDVVDTIRHRELLVERELEQGSRDEALHDHLREIYKGQGIEVPDRVIDDGIKALKDSRFVYTPPKPGLSVTLATLWVHRGRILARVFSVVLVLVLASGGYYFGIERPRLVAAEDSRIELSETLPKSLDTAYAAVLRDAKVDDARTQAAQLLADGKAALARGEADGARQAVASLGALDTKLVQTYDLMVVSSPDEDSGVFRIPSINEGARNYYLIVEAIGADGRLLPMDIVSEEDGRSYKLKSWGVRVSEAVFEAVKRDKMDDGIIENRLVGHKLRGELQVRYVMPVMGGTITSW
jgi:hypothetical protein